MEGISAIYKPKGPSSYDVIRQLKKLIGRKKIGHAGTLDPLARGVLVIGIGRKYTKQLAREVRKEKEYTAEIRLGETSRTDDAEGEKQKIDFEREPGLDKVKQALQRFIGKIRQVPPRFSAVKVQGKRAYQAARSGKELKLEPREVEVKDLELISYAWPDIKLRIVTGPGFYVRSLARDLGEALGTGAYLHELERVRVGGYTKDKTISIEEFKDKYGQKS